MEFIRRYSHSGVFRLHMPGHKGHGLIEAGDLTEVCGADSLYEAVGIIRESEQNASEAFGCPTYYSTEGSTQCIKAALYLAVKGKENPRVLAGANAHKAFVHAAALLGFTPEWLGGKEYLSCSVSASEVENALQKSTTAAVYLTSPDYLGNELPVAQIAAVCKRYGVPLIVDNAHGAYLKFLKKSRHPIDLGATLCASSAHKTLPVLTGGAYLQTDGSYSAEEVKAALSLFGSTSPSYLTLASLDKFNGESETFRRALAPFACWVESQKQRLLEKGLRLVGSEPLKLTVAPKAYGYTGTQVAAMLRKEKIECEFADPDYVVCMLSPFDQEGAGAAFKALEKLKKRGADSTMPPPRTEKVRKMSPREAMLKASEWLPSKDCLGRILAGASVSCPPAVPVLSVGEVIDENALAAFAYYGIERCEVVK